MGEKDELSNCSACTCVCEEDHQPHSLEVRTLLCDGACEQANLLEKCLAAHRFVQGVKVDGQAGGQTGRQTGR